jgi:hypothetical protein
VNVTCHGWRRSSADSYLQDEDEPADLDFSKMEDLGKKLGTYESYARRDAGVGQGE